MQYLTFEVPNELLPTLESAGYTPKQLSEEARHSLAALLFQRRVLSLGQAARLAGMSLWDFIPFLSSQGIAYIDYDDAEIQRELEATQWLVERQKKP